MSRVIVDWHNGGDNLPAPDLPFPRLEMLSEEQQRKAELTKASFLADIGRKLWRELFLEVNSLDDLGIWEDKIPSFECNCKKFYKEWKNNNPPTIEGDSIDFQWKWKLKSAVNQKLGHADLSLQEAKRFWHSQNQRV